MLKKTASVVLAAILLTGALTAGTVTAGALSPPNQYYAASIEELVYWIQNKQAEESTAWGSWYPFLSAARAAGSILTVRPVQDGYTLEQLHIQSDMNAIDFFYRRDSDGSWLGGWAYMPDSLPPPPEATEIMGWQLNISGGSGDEKWDSETVLALLAFDTVSLQKTPLAFTDVPASAWHYDAVEYAVALGLTNGTSAGRFTPSGQVTRGQLITMLCRAFSIAPREGDNFTDAGDTWYTGYLAAAKQLGLSDGVGGGKFAPERLITREEMFTLIYNAMVYLDVHPYGEGQPLSDFEDEGSVSPWARTAVAYLAERGVIKGSHGKILPGASATRAEMAQVFYSIFWLLH